MAELACTIDEFNTFIGPKIRNHIQSLTKAPKKRLGNRCQRCHEVKEQLDAAHIKGYDRKKIIAKVLGRHLVKGRDGIVKVNLEEVEREIIEAHRPIEKFIILLCKPCHRKYDGEKRAKRRGRS